MPEMAEAQGLRERLAHANEEVLSKGATNGELTNCSAHDEAHELARLVSESRLAEPAERDDWFIDSVKAIMWAGFILQTWLVATSWPSWTSSIAIQWSTLGLTSSIKPPDMIRTSKSLNWGSSGRTDRNTIHVRSDWHQGRKQLY
jgi:hypothetical protein